MLMNDDYYEERENYLAELSMKAAEKRETFAQNVLLVSSSILAILATLHSPQSGCLYIRLVFVFVMVQLVLCILAAGIALYDYSRLTRRIFQSYRSELQEARKARREMKMIYIDQKPFAKFCEKLSLILFVSSLISLLVYSSLISLL
jgi:hypothetical protein